MASTPEGPLSSPSPSEFEETPAQRQARLRRERRNAKIQSGGASRLEAISNISGRVGPPPENRPTQKPTQPLSDSPSPSPHPPNPFVSAPDPDEVDISSQIFQPRFPPQNGPGFQQPQAQQGPPGSDDPMMAMMQQLMRGMDPNAPPGSAGDLPPGFPPGMAKMFEAMSGGGGGVFGGGATQEAQEAAPSSAYVWRIVHAVFSLVLAVYIASVTVFTGSKIDRTGRSSPSYEAAGFYPNMGGGSQAIESTAHLGQRLFWMFATVEVVLQSSRYFLEKGRLPQSGLLGWLSQMLPEPYGGYARVVGRYSVIWNTVAADAMVVIFILGAVAWWKGVVA